MDVKIENEKVIYLEITCMDNFVSNYDLFILWMTDIYVGKSVNHFEYNEWKNNFHEIKYNMLQEKVLFALFFTVKMLCFA